MSDLDARAFAADPDQNVVLEASAGTGKTTVLVTRYVNLLLRGVEPANVLAITFTRKAAAEMRERIVRELRRAAEQSQFDRARWHAIRDRLAEIQISTIDAFCLALLREFPLEADLDPGFSLADETEVPRLVDQALDKSLAIFMGIAKREPEIALVLAQLGMKRTREGLAHLLQRRLVARDVLDRFLASGPSDLDAEEVCRRAVGKVIGLLDGVPGGREQFVAEGPVHHPRYQLLARDLRALPSLLSAENARIRAFMDRLSRHFLTTANERRSAERIHPYRSDHYPGAAAGKRHRGEALALSAAVEDVIFAFNRDLNVVLARGIRRMFSIALAQYQQALHERSLLDFSDVLERAVALLSRMDEFSQSRYRLEGRYHHVLVDEFQDTSRKQWELISLLVEAWGEGAGLATSPSIFIVGDRKQSIYRFRDAEVAVLQEAAGFISALRPGGSARRAITRSFRAVPELLAFVNDLFEEIGRDARRPDDFKYDEDDRFPANDAEPGESPERGAPALGLSAAATAEESAEAVADEVARILASETVRDKQTGLARRATAGDIAILFRSRTSHREFESALEARGIPTYVYKGLGFFDADEIKDVSALIRYLADPWSDLRAAAFLRSRFLRVSDAALAALAPRLAAALSADRPPAALDDLTPDDRRLLLHARAQVPRWLADVDRVPPADLIESIIPGSAYAWELRGPRRQQAWENLKKMRGLVRRIQNRGYATLARIADHLDSLTAGDESNAVLEALDSVNLMTVHAAKGLEFPIVFIVNLARGASGPPKPVRVSSGHVSIGPFVSENDDAERGREREETKRLLYVAMTRARDRLYLATLLKDGDVPIVRGALAEVMPSSLRDVLSRSGIAGASPELAWTGPSGRTYNMRCCLVPMGTPVASESSAMPRATPDCFGAPEHATASTPRVAVTDLVGQPSERRAGSERPTDALAGTLVHRLFRVPPDANLQPDGFVMHAVGLATGQERAACGEGLADLASRAVELWKGMRLDPEVEHLLSEGEAWFEVPFSMAAPETPPRIVRGTIDCLHRHPDGTMTVLEFKTGRPRPEHEAQLETYVRAAEALFPGTAVRGRILYPR